VVSVDTEVLSRASAWGRESRSDPGTVAEYRLLEPLGSGGMGIVYRAMRIGDPGCVALKTVRVPEPRWRDSILREIRALTAVRHPGLVRILDHGVDRGCPWYAMDLLEGTTLRAFGQSLWKRCTRPSKAVGRQDAGNVATWVGAARPTTTHGRRAVARRSPAAGGRLGAVLTIAEQLCAALAYMHGEGLVNCDLKPENILLVHGRPVIIDFGLSERCRGSVGREVLDCDWGRTGTLSYISPERIRGAIVDPRADLYALGCVLYELIVGSPPFEGAPERVVAQHLGTDAAPPSMRVQGVPDRLERVILGLLEKRPSHRIAYASDVRAELGALRGRPPRSSAPAPPSYLNRSRFVGRDDLVARLTLLRERACGGAGSIVVLSGETGSGKTRTAMELARAAADAHMRVVVSAGPGLGDAGDFTICATPLPVVRPLLRAIADHCHSAGRKVTARLLGRERHLLSTYEPSLADVPASELSQCDHGGSVQATSLQLFGSVAKALAAFAGEQPLVWIIDDLHRLDESSVHFLRSLTRDYISGTPVLILCTYCGDRGNRDAAEIVELPHVERIALERLDREAIASMASEMLGRPELPQEFVEFVARHTEGNPLFVAEYVREAVANGLVRPGCPGLSGESQPCDAPFVYDRMDVPTSLRQMIDRRLDRLGALAQDVLSTAALLGRTVDRNLLVEVARLGRDEEASALGELVSAQVIEPDIARKVTFAHDKLREIARARVPSARRRKLHARAGAALEARLVMRSNAELDYSVLGYHFAKAGESAKAAQYLTLAAERARSAFANADAVKLYREAIRQGLRARRVSLGDAHPSNDVRVEAHESLGDVLALEARYRDARDAYGKAVRRTLRSNRDRLSRLYRKCGRTLEAEKNLDGALTFYGRALGVYGCEIGAAPRRCRPQLIQAMLDRLRVCFRLGRDAEVASVSASLKPIVEAHGTTIQRAQFFQAKVLMNFCHPIAREELVDDAERALEACREVVQECRSELARATGRRAPARSE
jgi:serine/threonine protein kinase/tetratricopeptide (TPR) repeat protein